MGDGGQITETLTDYDATNNTYSYVINRGVLPVSNYALAITVMPAGDGSEVIWKGNFKRKAASATPAEGHDDMTALNAIKAVYKAGLDNLKRLLNNLSRFEVEMARWAKSFGVPFLG